MSRKIYYEVRLSSLYFDGSLIHTFYNFWDLSSVSAFVSKERDRFDSSFIKDVHIDYIIPYYDDSYSAFSESIRSGDLYVESVKCNNLADDLNGGD